MSQTLNTRGSNDPNVYRDTTLSNAAVGVSSCDLTGWNIINPNATPVYVKFYNASSGSITVGTTAVVKTLMIPGSSTVYLEHNQENTQYYFSSALSLACVTGIADTDATAPTTGVYIEIFYKPT